MMPENREKWKAGTSVLRGHKRKQMSSTQPGSRGVQDAARHGKAAHAAFSDPANGTPVATRVEFPGLPAWRRIYHWKKPREGTLLPMSLPLPPRPVASYGSG